MTEQWEIGRKLQAAREKIGMSKRQAAFAAGFSETWWRQLESGTISRDGEKVPITAPPETIARAAVAIQLDPRTLLPQLLPEHPDAETHMMREILIARLRTMNENELRVAEGYLTGLVSRA